MPEKSKLQQRINIALNRSETTGGQVFELFTSTLVIVICVIFVIQTYPIPDSLFTNLSYLETGITIFFLGEYIVRWWAKSFSIKYLFTPLVIIDLLAILPLFLDSHWQFVRLLRLFRIARLLRIFQHKSLFFIKIQDYHLRTLKILFTLSCLVFISSGLIYDVEHPINPDKISTFFDAVYYSVVTLSTVGFGDITPLSFEGKAITLLMIMTGVLLIPWQIGDLVRSIMISTEKNLHNCTNCSQRYHEQDAKFCKTCGHSIQIPSKTS
ncbi:MAG: voltage-gated potassium channel [Chlamydiales bacterium]|jgi:voltage-gated potassium channel